MQVRLASRVSKRGKDANSTPRSCLKCSKTFLSLGPFNRLCERCRRSNEELSRMDLQMQKYEELRPREAGYRKPNQ